MNTLVLLVQEMFEYNQWANQRLLQSLEPISDELYYGEIAIPFSNIHKLLNHLYYYDAKNSQRIIHGIAEPVIDKELARLELNKQLELNAEQWINWVKQQKEISSEIANQLMLLNTHNIHHRGQLSVGINLVGHKMPSLDAYKFRDAKSESKVY